MIDHFPLLVIVDVGYNNETPTYQGIHLSFMDHKIGFLDKVAGLVSRLLVGITIVVSYKPKILEETNLKSKEKE